MVAVLSYFLQVFGTDVMVTVAKSFDAPIKCKLGIHVIVTWLQSHAVMVPLDLPEKGLEASNFGMLGLGDIVIPGKDLWSMLSNFT